MTDQAALADKAAPALPPISFVLNGEARTVAVQLGTTLLVLLREHLRLHGTKIGCGHGQCGACTVLVDGRRRLSCLTLAHAVEGAAVITIEGVAGPDGGMHPVQTAFLRHEAFQCGYCTPGQVMSAVSLLSEGCEPTRAAVAEAMSGNLCRCGAYPHIVDAVLEALQVAATRGERP